MIPDRLAREVELLRDLSCRATACQQHQYFPLSRCQVRSAHRRSLSVPVEVYKSEHSHQFAPVFETNGVDFHGSAAFIRVDQYCFVACRPRRSEDLPTELLGHYPSRLRCDDGRVMLAASVPEGLNRRSVHPACRAVAVENKRGHSNLAQSLSDVARESTKRPRKPSLKASGHQRCRVVEQPWFRSGRSSSVLEALPARAQPPANCEGVKRPVRRRV